MVKAKRQKSKPNKQTHIKKNGNWGDISEFRAQLDALGLKIIQVTADGNCFFRAFADQFEGNEEEHQKYRSMVVQYILNNRDMFEPFIEDDVPFDEYCQSMEKDGTWAGNLELQAASLVSRTNICIHRKMSRRWYIQNFDNHEARMIHLSYHDGEHYNSVRLKKDTCNGPARPIIIKVLQQVRFDVDAAIEFLIAEQATENYVAKSERLSCPADTSHGVYENGKLSEELKDNLCMPEQICDKETTLDNETSQQDAKKIPRNKVCPCGSKKKYKACCGSVSGRSSKFTAIIQTVDYSKSSKERKQGKKGESNNGVKSRGCDRAPDVGALCI